MPRQALLTYDGSSFHPSGAQKPRMKSAVAIGSALESFRQKCTDAKGPQLVRLDLVNAKEHAKFVSNARASVSGQFGNPRADLGQRIGGTSSWFLDASQFLPALKIIDELQPIPEFNFSGVLLVHYKLEFRFLQPSANSPLPYQDREQYLYAEGDYDRLLGQSVISTTFSAQHSVSSFFSFPFENWSEESASLARSVQAEIPFRISDKRWKRWHLNKAASGYVGRRLAVSW